MTREIKFRGKRVDNGEWVYGYVVECEYGICIATNKSLYHVDGAEWNFDCILVIPETVGQFTGRKDENGKEVYEGDTVKHLYSVYIKNDEDNDNDDKNNYIGVIEYDSEYCKFTSSGEDFAKEPIEIIDVDLGVDNDKKNSKR